MPSSVLFLICSLIWGSTFFAITLQLGDIAPAVSVVYRFTLASVLLFAWCLARGQHLMLPWRTQRWMALQGAASFAVSYICTYSAEQYLVSALVGLLFALMVFWNPLLSRIAFGTPIAMRTLCLSALAMCGVTMLFFHSIAGAWSELRSGGSGHFLLGLGLAIAATLASSIGNLLVIKVREQSSNVPLTMAWSMLWGSALVALWALLTGQTFKLPATASYWGGLVYLAVFGSVIAFAAYFTMIHRIGPQKAAYIGVATPVISVLLSIRLEHFSPGPLEWAGMALCLASVAWALRPQAAKAPSIPQTESAA
ncbi:EamA family transporter [Oxalobacteraceae bacterium]|nr:EamA family transporter [Oxalobacteraceae bacterium]